MVALSKESSKFLFKERASLSSLFTNDFLLILANKDYCTWSDLAQTSRQRRHKLVFETFCMLKSQSK
jgi:hypothetical protein